MKGTNGYYRAKGIPVAPYTANDVIAAAALIAARFGANGGQEVRAALGAAAADVAKAEGADPTQWPADAVAERVKFTSGVLPDTMRWTNRPTFQRVVTFAGHRRRK